MTLALAVGRAVDVDMLAESSSVIGSNFRVVAPGPQLSGAALRGDYGLLALRPGLVLHRSDAVDLHNLVTRIEQRPGLTVQVFLEGTATASLGGRRLLPEAALRLAAAARPVALMTARTQPELFERRARRGARIRKVSLTVTPAWLEASGFDDAGEGGEVLRFAGTHLAQRMWLPSPRLVGLAEQILRPAAFTAAFRRLHLESLALSVLAEAFAGLGGPAPAAGEVTGRDRRRLQRVEDYLAAAGPGALSLGEMAAQLGISVSTLQRLFHAAYGMSAIEFLRRRAFDQAHDALDRGLSVKEAAYLAGYSSAANFATAFKRRFGRTPKGRTGGPA